MRLDERDRCAMPATAFADGMHAGGTQPWPCRDARLLLVEDNAINREVALELLRAVGLSADSAGDGREAVARARAIDYDLILMDIQMPKMNGLEATRAIRALPGWETKPILAMTANAFEDDHQACLAAGMDGFVAKPIDPAALLAALFKYLPLHAPASVAPVAALAMEDARPAPVADDFPARLAALPGIDLATARRYLGNKVGFHLRILKKFRDKHAACFMQDFQAARAADDWPTAARLAHSIGGLAGAVGATALATIAARLEQAALTRQLGPLNRLEAEIAEALSGIVAGLACLEEVELSEARKASPVDPGTRHEAVTPPAAGRQPRYSPGERPMNDLQRETILIVDDVPANIDILADILGSEYRVTFAGNGPDALLAAQALPQPSLILLDVMMPGMDGHEVCRRLKTDLRTCAIPIIFLTALADASDEELGLALGAVDYLHKPCLSAIVRQRVRIHLDLHNQNRALEDKVRERTRELDATRVEIVRRLGRAGEYRDNETGMHVIRMSTYCHRLALASGIPAAQAEAIRQAAPMHDIGKIGIPDHILLKPGKLSDEEWVVMKRHTLIGAEIIGEHRSELLTVARTVALTHHERWDGKGYPNGLTGEAIPIEGRIASICDVFDALLSVRPYKKAWSTDDAIAYIVDESGKAFEPRLVALFEGLLDEFALIRARYADSPA